MNASHPYNAFSGLDLLSSAVVLVDGSLIVRHLNPAAENLFAVSSRQLLGHPLSRLVGEPPELSAALENALKNNWSYTGHNIRITRTQDVQLHVDCTVTPIEVANAKLLLEVRPIDQQLKAAREEQLAQQQQAVGVGQDLHQAADGVGGLAQRVELQVHVGGHGRFRAHDFDDDSLLTNILFVNRLMPSIRHHRGLAPWPLPS